MAATRAGHRTPMPTRRRVTIGVFGLLLLPAELPVLPENLFAATPYAAEDDARVTIGWPQLARQVDQVIVRASTDSARVAVLTQSYGEAGALQRYGRAGVPVFSGQNSLWYYGHPTIANTGDRHRRIRPYGARRVVRDLPAGRNGAHPVWPGQPGERSAHLDLHAPVPTLGSTVATTAPRRLTTRLLIDAITPAEGAGPAIERCGCRSGP
jgi:hypothetical protein